MKTFDNSELQSKLATWSTENPTRRFDRLLRMIADLTWLDEAARITLASHGAHTPGVDGVRKGTLEPCLRKELADIRQQLLAGTYQPQPSRRVYIPKKNGKQRPLGIPTLRDRIVQRAMLMAMEPIWESDFQSNSYGFRPGRRPSASWSRLTGPLLSFIPAPGRLSRPSRGTHS